MGIYLWSARPLVFLSSFRRGAESVQDYGANQSLIWRPNSSAVVVITARGSLLVVGISNSGAGSAAGAAVSRAQAMYTPIRADGTGRVAASWPPIRAVTFNPPIHYAQATTAAIDHTVTSIVYNREELLVATTAGVIERMSWSDAKVPAPFFDAASAVHLSEIPFPAGEPQIPSGVHIVQMEYCSCLKVLAVVLSDGTAACLSNKESPGLFGTADAESQVRGIGT